MMDSELWYPLKQLSSRHSQADFSYTIAALGYNFYCAGDSFNSSLVAIVVVDPETLPEWAKSRGIKVGAHNRHYKLKEK